jgi:hypothetical protein
MGYKGLMWTGVAAFMLCLFIGQINTQFIHYWLTGHPGYRLELPVPERHQSAEIRVSRRRAFQGAILQ